tara:strand:+ start:480 stop:2003 length:1524 start_codon:yes stop_codon:yes gene_type:complete
MIKNFTINKIHFSFHLIFITIFFLSLLVYLPNTQEDAYIGFRYAENFANGHGLTFNNGEYVEGYTNFLFIILLSFFYKIGLATTLASKIIGVISSLIILLIIPRIIFYLTNGKCSAMSQYMPSICLSFYPAYTYWTTSGMETTFFASLLVLGFYFALVKNNNLLISSLFLILATLVRMEGILYFISIVLAYLAHNYVAIRKKDKLYLKQLLLLIIPYILAISIWELWRLSYYGSLLPNTYFIKMPAPDQALPISRGITYVANFWNSIGGISVLLMSSFFIFGRYPVFSKVFYVFIQLLWHLYIRESNGDWMVLHRFYIHLVPYIFIFLSLSIDSIIKNLKALNSFLIAYTIGFSLYSIYHYRNIQYHNTIEVQEEVHVGEWLMNNVDNNKTLAVLNAGALPYFSKLKTIDYYGLMNAELAKMPLKEVSIDMDSDGIKETKRMERFTPNWLLDQKPDLIEIPGKIVEGKLTTYAPLAKLLFDNDRFKNMYSINPLISIGQCNIYKAVY